MLYYMVDETLALGAFLSFPALNLHNYCACELDHREDMLNVTPCSEPARTRQIKPQLYYAVRNGSTIKTRNLMNGQTSLQFALS